MIFTIVPFLLIQQTPQAVIRADRFLKEHPAFQAKISLVTSQGDKADGTIVVERPAHLALTVRFPDTVYRQFTTPESIFESNSKERTYDEYPSHGVVSPPSSEVITEDWRMNLPLPIFSGNLEKFFGKDMKYLPEGEAKVGGEPVDVVHLALDTPYSHYSAHMSVDREGKILRYVSDGPKKSKLFVAVEFKDYRFGKSDPVVFRPTGVTGFVPFETPRFRKPLQMDERLPETLVADSTGKEISLAKAVGAPGMLAVVDTAWSQSPSGKHALSQIREALGKTGGTLVLLSDTSGKQRTVGILTDPTGATLKAIAGPGSPMFFWVRKKGTIERVWCGNNLDDMHLIPELKEAIEQPVQSREQPPAGG